MVLDGGRIARNYLKLWFWIDLFATIPYDLLFQLASHGQSSAQGTVTALAVLKTPRLLRLGRLLRLLDRMKGAAYIKVCSSSRL